MTAKVQCIKTRPETGPFNYLVCSPFAGKNVYFFINQNGEFLNSSYEGTWNKAVKQWEPKVEIIDLPQESVKKINEIAGKISYASRSNWKVKEYVKNGKKIIDQEKVDFLERKARRKQEAASKNKTEPVVTNVGGKASYTSLKFETKNGNSEKKQPWWKHKKAVNNNHYSKVS